MKESFQFYLFLALLCSLLLVSFSCHDRSEDRVVDSIALSDPARREQDLRLAKKVNVAIAQEEILEEYNIRVGVNNGVINLTGAVNTHAEHELLLSLVNKVEGVSQVKSRLRVKE